MNYRAQLAYEVFKLRMDELGHSQPTWENLPEHYKLAWSDAAQTIVSDYILQTSRRIR